MHGPSLVLRGSGPRPPVTPRFCRHRNGEGSTPSPRDSSSYRAAASVVLSSADALGERVLAQPGGRSGSPVPRGANPPSQRRQVSGHIRRQPAMVGAARWPIRPRLATCSDAANAPEKRKVGGSTPPLTTTLTCVDVCLATVRAQFATLVVSFLGHLPQADARTSTHSRRSQPHLLVQSAWDAAAAHSSSSPSPSSNRMIRMPSSLRPAGRPWRARRISRGYDLGGRPVRVARLLALSVRWGDGKQSSL